ncbi:CAP domain-containing protein [Chitinophaga sp. Mgbs1]|uniref:CAP domain-containing protein n=1 Tax=Chitinophaga solisilvae TaxID=1233460 RepID=A0A433WER5_9BACT|nr:CAP domain-containing protein [Chitinophaga solisilvae]
MSGKIMCAVFIIAVVILTGCSKEAPVFPVEKGPAATDTLTVPENIVDRKALLELVNGIRSRGCNCGGEQMPAVGPLTWSGLLEKAAYLHSKDMTINKYFDHNAPNGSTPASRIDAAGYRWNVYGENIASGNMEEQAVVLGWLSSPLHCRNMMKGNFTEFAVGRSERNWTMVLGSRSASH